MAIDTPSNLKKIAFPDKLYEFEPKGAIDYSYIRELKKRQEFAYFEPFGLRFHGAFKGVKQSEDFRRSLGESFNIAEITPTLEDVFIKTTEGKGL